MSNLSKNELINILISLGLQTKEAQIYLTSLEFNQPASAGKLAKLSDLNRGTTYHVVQELSKKGFLKPQLVNDVVQYSALPLENFRKFLIHQEQAIALKKKLLDETASAFQKIVSDDNQIQEIDLYQGKKAVMNFYNNLPWHEYHYCTFSAESFELLYPAETFYGTGSLKNLNKTKGLLLISQTNHPAHQRCVDLISKCSQMDFKIINEDRLNTDTMIFNNQVAIVYLEEKNLHAVSIKSQILTASYKKMFERVWNKKK